MKEQINKAAMRKSNRSFIPLWVMFLIYFFCYAILEIEMWGLLSIWSTGLSVWILLKAKLPSKKGIILSIVFAVLVSIAYLGLRKGVGVVIINGLMAGLPTLLCSLAVFSEIEKTAGAKIISKEKKSSPLISVVIAVAVGIALSVINYFLMVGSNEIDFGISIYRLLVCLSPAIYEEMAGRAIFMIFCLHLIGEKKPTKFQNFTLWFMMCLPHTLAHDSDIISTIILSLLFGLPFAILQKKRDIATAMISHGIVDAVRFTIFGLGL